MQDSGLIEMTPPVEIGGHRYRIIILRGTVTRNALEASIRSVIPVGLSGHPRPFKDEWLSEVLDKMACRYEDADWDGVCMFWANVIVIRAEAPKGVLSHELGHAFAHRFFGDNSEVAASAMSQFYATCVSAHVAVENVISESLSRSATLTPVSF